VTTYTDVEPTIIVWFGFLVFNITFSNISAISCRISAASDKVYQLLAHGRWFSPGTLASSTTKTDRHDIAEILLKVALNTMKQTNKANYFVFPAPLICL
jgi:hypothetical protein